MGGQPFCTDPFNRVRVTSEGDVFFCCYQRKTPIGNLLTSSMEEIWDSPLAREIRESTARGVMHKTCLVPCPKAYVPKVKHQPPVEPTPQFLDIDPPNTHCNVGGKKPTLENPACIMCERSVDDYRFEDDRSQSVLPKLAPILPQIKMIHVQGVSEVFWQDLLFKYLETLNFAPFKNSIILSTTSNATVFPPKKQEKWLASAASTGISFSIDAASASTYEKIRILPVYETVLNNIRNYSRLVANTPQHRFRIQNNINTLNLHEVRGMVAFAAEVEADEIEFNLTGGHRTEILINDENRADFIRAYEEATDQGIKDGIKVVFLRPC